MTPQQIQQLKDDAEADAKYLALLLLLALENHAGPVAARVRWNAKTAQFLVDNRVVSFQTLRTYLARIENKLGRRLLKISTDLAEGRITIDEWRADFERTVRTSHVLAGALAVGGITRAIRNVVVLSRINEELSFADKFVREVRSRKIVSAVQQQASIGVKEVVRSGKTISVARVRSRANSYLRAIHITFEEAKHELIMGLGVHNEARRYMRAVENCKPCVHWAGLGWVPIEIMPTIGSFSKEIHGCDIYCRCFIVYRTRAGGEE
jgi:hypothetical protein